MGLEKPLITLQSLIEYAAHATGDSGLIDGIFTELIPLGRNLWAKWNPNLAGWELIGRTAPSSQGSATYQVLEG